MRITESEFKALLDKYLNGSASPDEKKLLDQFFDSYGYDKGESQDLNFNLREKIYQEIQLRKEKTRVLDTPNRFPSWLKVAAVILPLLIGSFTFYQLTNTVEETPVVISKVEMIERSTVRGQRLDVNLPDGSFVKLNSNSSVRYPSQFTGNKREVTLTGEAYFKVAHDASKPFFVHTGKTSTQVLGTSFNVHAGQEKITVTLVEGKVKVLSPNVTASLSPNQQATVGIQSGKIETRQVDVLLATGWTTNKLAFKDVKLGEVLETLENWYNVDIELSDVRMKNCEINGTYENQSLENVMNSFKFMLNITYKIDKNHVTITGKGCN